MDERNHERLIALVARRRKQLKRLEQQVLNARQLVLDAEMELKDATRGNSFNKTDTLHTRTPPTAATKASRVETCKAASKALRACKRARERGVSADKLCGEAGRALRRCADAKKRGRQSGQRAS